MTEIRDDEGYIDVRFVLGRDDDPVACPYIMRVERAGYRLPKGTTASSLEYLVAEMWDSPNEAVEDLAGVFEHFPKEAFNV